MPCKSDGSRGGGLRGTVMGRMICRATIAILALWLPCGCADKAGRVGGIEARATRMAVERDLGVERCSGEVREVLRLIEMSDNWWVEGEQNRVQGEALLAIKEKYPEAFEKAMGRAGARESALVLMEAAAAKTDFTETPVIINLERQVGAPSEGGYTVDLGIH